MATTPIPLYRYPLDPTGVSPDNLVVGEEHQLSTRTVRCIAPTYGGFYAESVVVKDFATNMTLVRGVDYIFGELFEFPTGRYGKEIFGIIAIIKPGVTKVSINYQALGGDYSYSMDALIAMIDNLNIGERPVEWGAIIGRPATFEPASHLHDLGDVYGFEYMIHAIDLLRQAILTGDTASHDEIYRYIDNWGAQNANALAAITNSLNLHLADRANPHQVTKAQVGLGNVQNYPIATQVEMNAGAINTAYVTPLTVANFVLSAAVIPIQNHINNRTNPHFVTKAQVGLGSVENYAIATQVEMDTGTSDALYTTPLKVATYVATKVLAPLTGHIADKNNPHAVTKAQVGLSSVQNYPVASQQTMNEATLDTFYVTPLTVGNYVKAYAIQPMETHIGRADNPHQVTKVQVGLGNVVNYGISGEAEAEAGISDTSYMTPNATRRAIDAQVGVSYRNHISNTLNPHATTAAQVGAYTTAQVDSALGAVQTLLTNHTSVAISGRNPHGTTAADIDAMSMTTWNNSIYPTIQAQINTKQPAGNYAIISNNAYFASLQATVSFVCNGESYFDGNIWCRADITAFWSDARLKENVRVIDSPLEKVKKIMGVTYTHNQLAHELTGIDTDTEHMGLLAQQVQEVAPQVVGLAPFDRDPETGKSISGENYITVKYDKLVALLVEAVKELDDKCQKMSERLAALEA